jgi:hypothetical protein
MKLECSHPICKAFSYPPVEKRWFNEDDRSFTFRPPEPWMWTVIGGTCHFFCSETCQHAFVPYLLNEALYPPPSTLIECMKRDESRFFPSNEGAKQDLDLENGFGMPVETT